VTSEHPLAEAYCLRTADIRTSFDRASESYDRFAIVESRVRDEILARLELVNLKPRVILDAGCATGSWGGLLLKRYKRSRLLALDLSVGMLLQARKRRPRFRKLNVICADAAAIPLADASVDLICSNLMLPWCNDIDQVFREFRRVLSPRGLLTFSTLGPDTLTELRQSWRSVDDKIHVNRFVDMHDIGDALVRAGLAEPVMDVDYYHISYRRLIDLMREIKAVGAHNMNQGRPRGLTGRQRIRAVEAAYDKFSEGGRLPATCEVIFGQAWGPRARTGSGGVEVMIPITEIGHRRPGRNG
jgi:malonyl-CoA O-methyltransferase